MAAVDYTYSISTDFPNQTVDLQSLSTEIESAAFGATLLGISTIGDDCIICFDLALTPTEEATLNGIVAAHTGTPNDESVAQDPVGGFGADRDPTVNDDETVGFGITSQWYNLTDFKQFSCFDATPGAAIWIEITAAAGDVLGPGSSTIDHVVLWANADGTQLKDSPVSIDGAGNIATAGQVDGRDVSADGAALDAHILDLNNPHQTDISVVGPMTLAELNAAISDANLDDSSDGRPPLPHNFTHGQGQFDELLAQNLGSGPAPANQILESDGSGGWNLVPVPGAGGPHALGGGLHTPDTLANLNALITDANLDDAGQPRDPNQHDLAGPEHGPDNLANLNALITDANLDDENDPRPALPHDFGGTEHTATNLAALNALIADATLDDANDPRDPVPHAVTHNKSQIDEITAQLLGSAGAPAGQIMETDGAGGWNLITTPSGGGGGTHGLGSATHTADTLANLNALITDANLDDENAPRPPLAHGLGGGDHTATTLAALNALITDAVLDDTATPRDPTAHAPTHERGGADEMDGDHLSITYVPVNYTRDTSPAEADDVMDLTAHLAGLDAAMGSLPGTGDVVGPASATDEAIARFDSTTGKLIQDSSVSITDAGDIITAGLVDGRDVSADGSTLDTHVGDTNNPHGTDLTSLGSGTLAQLNALVTDATLDDASAARTPVAHAGTHLQGAVDELEAQLLGSGAASSGQIMETDGAGGWNLIATPTGGGGVTDHGALTGLGDDDHTQYQLRTEKDAANGYAGLDGSGEISDGVHGSRGGGGLHALATVSVAGFLSAADKTKLDGIPAGATDDHGALTGLGDDDHTQYSLADGTRAFTGTVSGVTPTAAAHLATKGYVDGAITTPDHGSLTGLGDDDHTQYTLADGSRAFTGTVGGITPVAATDLTTKGYVDGEISGAVVTDHGGLTGLGDDDHTQYSLADGTRAFTGVVGGVTPTAPNHLTTKSYVDGVVGTTDHGLLSGLGDDDHTQYQLRTEKDAANGYAGLDAGGEISDAVHGSRGGGALHAVATTTVAGFMSGADKTKLDGIPSSATDDHGSLSGLGDDDHTQYSLVDGTRAFTGTVGGVTPVAASDLATKGYVDGVTGATDHGALTGLADDDHTQYQLRSEKDQANGYAGLDASSEIPDATHGNRGGGALHAVATTSVAGFMSAADKTKLDGVATGAEVDAKDAKVSSNDTTPGFLEDKIVAGTNVTIATLNDGGNETLQISATGGGGGSVAVSHATATNTVSTTSENPVLVPGMTLTPGAGDYVINFSSTMEMDENDEEFWIQIYVGGVAVAESKRPYQFKHKDKAFAVHTHAFVTGVGASDAIEVRWWTDDDDIVMYQRNLIAIKVN